MFANKKIIEANPEKYLPQYEGYYAYGIALRKGFEVDSERGR